MEPHNRLINLGLNIKAERVRKQISQEQLAELVNTSRNSISMIETARMHSTILKIVDIAKALNIDINELLKGV
jgi:putative transcriptional regulator